MLNPNPNFDDNYEDIEVVDGNFTISSGSNDPSAFFNMNPSNNQQNFGGGPSFYSHQVNGGFGSMNFYGHSSQNDQIVTPNVQQAEQGPPQCSGNCGACVWSFLCKKASANFSSIGGCAPRLA